MLHFAGFELDQQRAELRGRDGATTKLRPKTLEMLRLFAANAGRVLSKQELMEAVWPNVNVGEDSLFRCIREIRAALGDDQRQMIKLVSGRGYVFDAEVSEEAVGFAAHSDTALPARVDDAAANAERASEPAKSWWFSIGMRARLSIATVAMVGVVIGFAFAAQIFGLNRVVTQPSSTIAVAAIVDTSPDGRGTAMAARVTDRLIDGFAKIENVGVLTLGPDAGAERPRPESLNSAQADFVVRGELQRGPQAWTLQTRMVKTATGEVQSVAAISIDINDTDPQLQQTRLAAGVGHQLAQHLNRLLESTSATSGGAATGNARVAIEQAVASINQTTRERFGTAQTMLRSALTVEPDNIDVAVALVALQMRGIQMAWHGPAEAIVAEAQARVTLERALRTKPNSISVLETYCRFLSATNRFVESLVTCARALNFDPWNGLALYLIGLGQIRLGRFEDALATFQQADRFDTPDVSRWTWLLGAGLTNVLMERYEDALPWLQRSIAITPASGRSHMLLAAAYQQLALVAEAKMAMQKGLELRPGTTALNVMPPTENASPLYIDASERVVQLMIAAGLPEG